MSNESDFSSWYRAADQEEWGTTIHSVPIGDPEARERVEDFFRDED